MHIFELLVEIGRQETELLVETETLEAGPWSESSLIATTSSGGIWQGELLIIAK